MRKAKLKKGRPTLYKPEYCQMLIEHMAQGLGFKCFAAVINVNEDTLYEWLKHHQAFSDAKKVGFSRNRLWWEKAGVAGTVGKIAGFNATMYIFNMKNRFPEDWRERQEVDTQMQVDFSTMPPEQFEKLMNQLGYVKKAQ